MHRSCGREIRESRKRMWQVILGVIGSLGLFIYGMKIMSEGLQKASGEKLRNVMKSMTKNRFYGVLTGILVTTSVQSSSATTVMVVGFVNARLLTLREAIGVIMGANLGTTVTFWLIALVGFKFNVSQFALPMVAFGTICLFTRSIRARDYGQFIVGLGLVFMGLSLLKDSVPDIAHDPDTYAFLASLGEYGFGSILLFFFIGILLTVAVQSSSAAGAISLALAYKGWIDYELSAAIVLGENIGTTITAILASLAGDRQAKRAALAHLVFNVIGVIWALILFHPFLNLSAWLLPGATGSPDSLPGLLALFHTLFNLFNTCLLIGFVPYLARFVERVIPEGKPAPVNDRNRLSYITGQLTEIGELNLIEGQKEVCRLAGIAEDMFNGFVEVYHNPDKDLSEQVKKLRKMEQLSDDLAEGITQYLILCSAHELSERSAASVAGLMRVVAELEDICDCCYRLVLTVRKRYRKSLQFSPDTSKAFTDYCDVVNQFLTYTRSCLGEDVGAAKMERAVDLENLIDSIRKRLRKQAISRMESKGNIRGEILFIDAINQMEKIGNHSLNILQALQRS